MTNLVMFSKASRYDRMFMMIWWITIACNEFVLAHSNRTMTIEVLVWIPIRLKLPLDSTAQWPMLMKLDVKQAHKILRVTMKWIYCVFKMELNIIELNFCARIFKTHHCQDQCLPMDPKLSEVANYYVISTGNKFRSSLPFS